MLVSKVGLLADLMDGVVFGRSRFILSSSLIRFLVGFVMCSL